MPQRGEWSRVCEAGRTANATAVFNSCIKLPVRVRVYLCVCVCVYHCMGLYVSVVVADGFQVALASRSAV